MFAHFGIVAVCLYLCAFSLSTVPTVDAIVLAPKMIDRSRLQTSQQEGTSPDVNAPSSIEPANLRSKAAAVVVSAGSSLYNRAFFSPVYRLYRHGPALHGYGFWRGAPSHEICAALTNVESDFWKNHSNECESLIAKEVQAYVVLIETITYFGLLLYALKASANCLCRLRRHDEPEHTKRLYSPPKRRSTPLYLSTPPRSRTQ